MNMTKLNQVYRCNVCGNIVEVLNPGEGKLVCCGQEMELLLARKTDVGPEKHVPVIENFDNKIKVRVGKVPHPMESNHYILWIELITPKKSYRISLNPGDKPEAIFPRPKSKKYMVRCYCNIHGLWHDLEGKMKF